MTDWTAILAAVTEALTGDKPTGKAQLDACWDAAASDDHAARCVIAHYLADLQPTLDDELAWDERALAAHPGVRDADLAPIGIAHAAALAPSLHLNLGECYRRAGRLNEAAEQARLGLAGSDTLSDDGYGQLVRGGLQRLAERLAADG